MAAGTPACRTRRAPSTPHLHRLLGRASGCARARPGRTRREQTSPAGPGGREHPRAGPEMPSPTCHFARSCCRGCGNGRRLETQCVRARECARVSVRSCLRCSSLTAPGATNPLPHKEPAAEPPPGAPSPAPRLPPRPHPASLPPRRAVLTSAEAGVSGALLREAAGQRRPTPPACPLARRARRVPGSGPRRPSVARRSLLASPRVSLLVLASRLQSPSCRLAAPTCPGYGACPVRRARAGLGVGRGRAGRPAAASRRGGEGAPAGLGTQPRRQGPAAQGGGGQRYEKVGGASGEASPRRAPRGSLQPPPGVPARRHVPSAWGPDAPCVAPGAEP